MRTRTKYTFVLRIADNSPYERDQCVGLCFKSRSQSAAEKSTRKSQLYISQCVQIKLSRIFTFIVFSHTVCVQQMLFQKVSFVKIHAQTHKARPYSVLFKQRVHRHFNLVRKASSLPFDQSPHCGLMVDFSHKILSISSAFNAVESDACTMY